ncbi:hypothetical protein IKB17_05560 [bacterium]|nr:hypothetical protein [bacterium]
MANTWYGQTGFVAPQMNFNNYIGSNDPYCYNSHVIGATVASSSSKETSGDVDVVMKKKKKKSQEISATNTIYQKKAEELEEKKKEYEKIEKGKKEDGSAVIEYSMSEYKKLPGWKRALRAVTNMGQGVLNLCTKFIGMEDGKMNWGKCLKNVGISLLALGACAIPVVGPFIGYGLLATGVVSGAVSLGRGISNLKKAETVQERDNAWQEIGTGAFIGVTSAAGLKGLGKGFRTSYANGISPVKPPSVANGRTTLFGKAWQKTSQYARDMFVNSFKATRKKAIDQRSSFTNGKRDLMQNDYHVGSNLDSAPLWVKTKAGFRSYYNNWKANLKESLPATGKRKFEEAKNRYNKQLEDKINQLNQNDPLYNYNSQFLNSQKNNLPTTKEQWVQSRKESSYHNELKTLRSKLLELKNGKDVEFKYQVKTTNTPKPKKNRNNEKTITLNSSNTEHIKSLENLIKQTESLAKEIETLAVVRKDTMRGMALRPKKNQDELVAYAGSSRTRLGYLWDTVRGTTKWYRVLGKGAWEAISLSFKPWMYLSKTPAGTYYKVQEGFFPVHEKNFFIDLLKMLKLDLGADITVTNEEIATLTKEIADLEKELGVSKKASKVA